MERHDKSARLAENVKNEWGDVRGTVIHWNLGMGLWISKNNEMIVDDNLVC
jgi:hypothetical protein